jgi:hypothetical protein
MSRCAARPAVAGALGAATEDRLAARHEPGRLALSDLTARCAEPCRHHGMGPARNSRRPGQENGTVEAAKEPARRYEQASPGEPILLDVKKLGRIERVGHRTPATAAGAAARRRSATPALGAGRAAACGSRRARMAFPPARALGPGQRDRAARRHGRAMRACLGSAEVSARSPTRPPSADARRAAARAGRRMGGPARPLHDAHSHRRPRHRWHARPAGHRARPDHSDGCRRGRPGRPNDPARHRADRRQLRHATGRDPQRTLHSAEANSQGKP